MHDVKKYYWDESYLFKECMDNIIRRCVSKLEIETIHEECYSSVVRGHHGGIRTVSKVLQSGYCFPTLYKDAYKFSMAYLKCKLQGNILRRHEFPLTVIVELEVFDVWG